MPLVSLGSSCVTENHFSLSTRLSPFIVLKVSIASPQLRLSLNVVRPASATFSSYVFPLTSDSIYLSIYQPIYLTFPSYCRLKAEKWFGNRKDIATVRTVISHIENMMKGVTNGFRYKMKSVYAHFPINIAIQVREWSINTALWSAWFCSLPFPGGPAVDLTFASYHFLSTLHPGSHFPLFLQPASTGRRDDCWSA